MIFTVFACAAQIKGKYNCDKKYGESLPGSIGSVDGMFESQSNYKLAQHPFTKIFPSSANYKTIKEKRNKQISTCILFSRVFISKLGRYY